MSTRNVSMLRGVLVAIVLLAGSVQDASAFLGLGEVTTAWEEDVLLRSGQVLPIKRTQTIGPDEWFRAGRGLLLKQTIAFKHDGKSVKWTYDVVWPIHYKPDLLDIVDGEPVVVMPIFRQGPCEKYGFPKEGMVAFRYRGKRWTQVSVGELPADLKVNLLLHTHPIQHRPEYKGKRIDLDAKRSLDRIVHWGPEPGWTLAQAGRFYSDIEDACLRMRPPPDPQLDADRQRNREAELNAVTVRAEGLEFTDLPEPVDKAVRDRVMGVPTGYGHIRDSCKGVVDRIQPSRAWSDGERGFQSWSVGLDLVLTPAPGGRKVPLSQARPKTSAQLQCVLCDEDTIYVVRRSAKETLILHRFTRTGELVDAVLVDLPDADRLAPGRDWGTVWTVTPEGGKFLMVAIVDFVPDEKRWGYGTLNRQTTYRIPLPAAGRP